MSDNDERNVAAKLNISWVEHVFTSRAVTEELLNPERESGNITPNDYERALDFFPRASGLYRYHPIVDCLIFGVMGTIAVRYKRPQWSPFRKAAFVTSVGLVGHTIGKATRLFAHVAYAKSIESDGYGQAIRNVEARIGISNDKFYGPTLALSRIKSRGEGESPNDSITIMLPGNADMNTNKPITPQHSVQNKWDEIRKANARAANNSSWDLLRQKHEREGVKTRQREKVHEAGGEHDAMFDRAAETDEPISIDRFADSGDKYLDNSK